MSLLWLGNGLLSGLFLISAFFNWNRVKIRYCDGASFKGHGQNETAGTYFRGQQIWLAVIDELMSKGMKDADQVS
ncbi:hypothetical protein Leryth_000649 [Lithospermum erythrorhizon]|nr:hypothetical protein Leryth_000649 [Lithospermum erythrorhizon]